VDPLDRIDEIIAMVEGARSVPMSRNCIVDRAEAIGLLDQLRSELPSEMRRANALLDERDKILDAGKREAERIIISGEQEHARLVSVNEITVSAEHEGNRLIADARPRLSGSATRSTTTWTRRSPTSSSSLRARSRRSSAAGQDARAA